MLHSLDCHNTLFSKMHAVVITVHCDVSQIKSEHLYSGCEGSRLFLFCPLYQGLKPGVLHECRLLLLHLLDQETSRDLKIEG